MILMPAIIWKPGKPNVRIRKAGIVCLIRLVEEKLIDEEKLYLHFKNLFNLIKNCMDDDFTNDIRFASVVCVKHLVGYLRKEFIDEDYKIIYVELLKRLDDS
jgi:hypothetical protein